MSLMDAFLPQHQFCERHQVTVRCNPGRLLDIIQDYRPPRDRVGETAMRVRQLPASLVHWLAPAASAFWYTASINARPSPQPRALSATNRSSR